MPNTGTLYSFTDENESEWVHTTDFDELKSIILKTFIAAGYPILINEKRRTITDVGCNIMTGEAKGMVNEHQIGKINPYTVQCIITYKDV